MHCENGGRHGSNSKMHADDKQTAQHACGVLLVICIDAANEVV